MLEEWFEDWLTDHVARHTLIGLPTIDSDDGPVVYAGWRDVFRAKGIDDPALAREASILLLAERVRGSRDHFPALLGLIERLRRDLAATHSGAALPPQGLAEASVLSEGCPECGGTGWAHRRARWQSMPRIFVLDLFCRCPIGRWRKAHDPAMRYGAQVRRHDDLQARPDLWDAALALRRWSPRPCGHDLVTKGREGEDWWYLWPDPELHTTNPDCLCAACIAARQAQATDTAAAGGPVS